MSEPAPKLPQEPGEDPVRPHVFDGIQEYDKRLPNWWLLTFYGAIVFAVIYWLADQHFPSGTSASRLGEELARIDAAKLSSSSAQLDDNALWKMSRNPVIVKTGEDIFMTTCASCHGKNMEGGIGVKLSDDQWIHGGRPMDLIGVVNTGVLAKGMPTWGPVLGAKKISAVVSYVLSKHPAPAGVE
ncbi:cytochrome C oxidase subunit III [Verrucomicrobia bacterium IMCC26134]|jgi:cytochrome c oxidase cbb3-type subunit 3|nr:cytochrome C oxidase subunit III [Verrucomicrobia bacterium IMCC26134]